VITARSLSKCFGRTPAVRDLSFEIRPGSVTGFLGPNGSGKSTTMRMIMGLDIPDSGTALVNGMHYAELRWPLREVGALLDARAFHPGRTAYGHLRQLAASNDIAPRRVDEVLELVGLSSVARQRAGKYSLGMGQRLGIAAALLGDPGVLLFDEPVNGLDPEGIRWVRHLLRRMADEGRTVFVSSHLISEMSLTAERLVVIGRGALIADTSVKDFTAMSAGETVRVLAPAAQSLAALLRAAGAGVQSAEDGSMIVSGLSSADIGRMAAHRSITLHELTPLRESLEDAFMRLTHGSVEFASADRRASRETLFVASSTGGPEEGP
jgi:ABC-2 type transport system ATP-binding protein